MSNFNSLLTSANLALASYARLLGGTSTDLAANQQTLRNDGGGGMTQLQAQEFAQQFPNIIVQTIDDSDLNGAGSSFSATVFKDTSGNLSVAFRGTAEIGDFVPTDLNIAQRGAAYDQIAAMYNWWLREASPQGQMVSQYRVRAYPIVGPTPPAGSLELYTQMVGIIPFARVVLETAPSVQASGKLFNHLAADPDVRVDLVGHSLGGHLAMAFKQLFSMNTGEITVFNAPGFLNSAINQAFFERLGGVVPTLQNSSTVVNVVANEASIGTQPWNAVAGLHLRPGAIVDIPIENQYQSGEPKTYFSLNHGMVPLADSIAVGRLLSSLDPLVNTNDYRLILHAAALGTPSSLERVVDALESLIGIDDRPMSYGNHQREKLYAAISVLNTAISDGSLAGTVRIGPLTGPKDRVGPTQRIDLLT